MSPVAFANEPDNSASNGEDGIAVVVDDSFNKDLNVEKTVTVDESVNDSYKKDVDIEKTVTIDESVNDSYKKDVDIEKTVTIDESVDDSFKNTATDSFNTDSSTDNSIEIGDVAVSATVLVGSVSSGTVTLDNAAMSTSHNEISGGALANTAGITSVAQNGGINGQIQQGISVQSNLTLGGN